MIPNQEYMKNVFEIAANQEVTAQQTEDGNAKREELRAQAMKFLYDNQECYVAQWILQNPFANPEHYALKFVYNDSSMLGYSVTMEKLPNV
jgi:hypothetical protein